jgi:proteasome assembly chaperone (PAC2) family protein
LGGYGTGSRVHDPDVLAAATDKATAARLRKPGVRLPDGDGPAGGIIGASGLFLGLGAQRGLQGACLMGETNGYLVDPKAARAVLEALGKVLGGRFDLGGLEDTASELDRITAQLTEALAPPREGPEHYIG